MDGERGAVWVWERVLRIAWVEGGRVDGFSCGVVGIVKRRWVARVEGRRERSEMTPMVGRRIFDVLWEGVWSWELGAVWGR